MKMERWRLSFTILVFIIIPVFLTLCFLASCRHRQKGLTITLTFAGAIVNLMSKRLSPQQIDANRQNARKSTGPRTAEGRAVSKMNALKHGILSKEVLVRALNLNESSRELSALHERFRQELQPRGPVEEMLVDQIVTTHWRLRRALTAESGEIALSVDQGRWQRQRPDPQVLWLKWEAYGDTIQRMEDSLLGNRLLESWLGELRAEVELVGELTEAAVQKVVQVFRGKPNSLTSELEELRLKLAGNPEGLGAVELRERNKNQTLAFLSRKLGHLAWLKRACEEHEKSKDEATLAAAVLPSMATLEKILRYETKLERQLFRAMAQLERLQRIRRGEDIPAPLSVELSERT